MNSCVVTQATEMEPTSSEKHVDHFMTDSIINRIIEPGYIPDVSLMAMAGQPAATGVYQGRLDSLVSMSMPEGGGGVLPYISHTGMCRPSGCGFFTIHSYTGSQDFL